MNRSGDLPSLDCLTLCFDQLKLKGGLHTRGTFFQTPSVTEVNKLQASVKKHGYYKLLEVDSPNLLIALALNMLKQTSQPVIPFDLYDYVLEVSNQSESSLGYVNRGSGSGDMGSSGGEEEEEGKEAAEGNIVKFWKLTKLVRRLPLRNWMILLKVLELLSQVADLSTVNEASLDSVVRIFSPILCRPRGSAYMSLRHLHDLHKIETVVRSLVVKHKALKKLSHSSSVGGEEHAGSMDSSFNSSTSSDAPCRLVPDALHCSSESENVRTDFMQSDMSFSVDDMATVDNIIDESVSVLFDDISEFKSFASNLEAMKSNSDGKLPEAEVERSSSPQFVCSPLLSNTMNRVVWNSLTSKEGSGSGPCKALQDGSDQSNAKITGASNPAELSFMLSGTLDGPRDRRRMIAACRTLRSQINQYEDTFLKGSGHLPRGHERYPFASTYAQYKQWKRKIRYDASSRVQALVRGFIARRKYPLMQCKSTHRKIEQSKAEEKNSCHHKTELQKLLAEKKRVKNQLKEYDQTFLENTGRNPMRADKEPMKDTYKLYSNLKHNINKLESLVRTAEDKNIDSTGDSDNEGEMEHNQKSQILLHEKLKRDKKILQTLLERYEWSFKRVHGRGVNCRADIAPVEAEYIRYRKIKQKLNKKSP